MAAQQVNTAAGESDARDEPGAFWNEPGLTYWDRALNALGLDERDLPAAPEVETFPYGFPMGVYPAIDAVYTKAWKLRLADERAAGRGR